MDKSIAFSILASPLFLLSACGADDDTSTPGEPPPPTQTAESAPIAAPHGFVMRNAARVADAILRAGFEDASPQCNDWTSEGGTGIRSIPARSGDYACKICSTGEVPILALANATGPLEPGRYALEAWVRARVPSVSSASVVLEASTAGGPVVQQGSDVAVGDDYTRVEVVLDAASAIDALKLRVEAPASKSECVLVDDVVLTRRF